MGEIPKRELRREKREVKRAGVKRVRRSLKRLLDENPEDPPSTPFDFGHLSSTRYNGLDRDASRLAWKRNKSREASDVTDGNESAV